MCQVLFWIHLDHLAGWLPAIPIYGFGTMLFIAFVLCTWVSGTLAQRDGIPRERIQDLAIWLFVFGLSGARLLFVLNPENDTSIWNFFAIWDGGLVYYGFLFLGGVVGFLLALHGTFSAQVQHLAALEAGGLSRPSSLALGLCLGRIGCLLNGCNCYGNTVCPALHGNNIPLALSSATAATISSTADCRPPLASPWPNRRGTLSARSSRIPKPSRMV